ncbi:MAG: homoserine dehydrogenase [Planctomycetaceae bacterium]|nr:homoserine dehydrogenase [Planctomycetaceae bacterium]
METAKVAIIGFGTIGSGVARLLLEHRDRIARRAGKKIELVHVVDKDLKRSRNIALPPGVLTSELSDVTNDPEIVAAVELVGGLEPARSIVLELLESGKNIVTANKALLAEHGPELFDRARQLGRTIAFEAAVAGGIPIIASIGECLIANQIESIHAILNGTSNFILSQMEENNTDYASAVAEAQQRGYAEANPAMDVNGSDAAQKLAILAHLAFGARVNWRNIPRTGIDIVDVADMRFAKELGYSIKLLAVAELVPEGLELHVSPTLIRQGTTLAEVRGAYNAVRVVGDAVGRVFYHGLGAGQMPTASAVVADLVNTVAGRTAITFERLNLWSTEGEPRVRLRDAARVPGRFYLRFNVDDRPGVMAEIASILGAHNISIASVIQHEAEEDDASNTVPLIIMTHMSPEGAVADALKTIGQLACVHPGSVRMRVRD